MAAPHDDVVVEAGLVLKQLGCVVFADLKRQRQEEHGFGRAYDSLKAPPNLLAAFVPTQAMFRNFTLLSPDWHVPDLVLECANGYRYVVDVCQEKDPNTEVARKIETVLHNASEHKIVGLALIDIGDAPPRNKDLSRLVATFQKLFGGALNEEADMRRYSVSCLRILWDHVESPKEVTWERIALLKGEWKEELRKHAQMALDDKQLLVRPRDCSATL